MTPTGSLAVYWNWNGITGTRDVSLPRSGTSANAKTTIVQITRVLLQTHKGRLKICALMPSPQKKHKYMHLLCSLAKQIMVSLGKGHAEKVYHRALITGLNAKRVPHRSEVLTPVYFMGEVVGMGRCDLVIGELAVEIKANRQHPSKASAQIKKYTMNLSKAERRAYTGVVINFNQRRGGAQTWVAPHGQ
jgi:GxxExxY protein